MLSQKIITIAPGGTEEVRYKLDFQQGVAIFSIIPIAEDESVQVSRNFKADAHWSNNDKFFIVEPICAITEEPVESSGEALISTVQGVYCKVSVTNLESSNQKFYVSLNVPGTPSAGVM